MDSTRDVLSTRHISWLRPHLANQRGSRRPSWRPPQIRTNPHHTSNPGTHRPLPREGLPSVLQVNAIPAGSNTTGTTPHGTGTSLGTTRPSDSSRVKPQTQCRGSMARLTPPGKIWVGKAVQPANNGGSSTRPATELSTVEAEQMSTPTTVNNATGTIHPAVSGALIPEPPLAAPLTLVSFQGDPAGGSNRKRVRADSTTTLITLNLCDLQPESPRPAKRAFRPMGPTPQMWVAGTSNPQAGIWPFLLEALDLVAHVSPRDQPRTTAPWDLVPFSLQAQHSKACLAHVQCTWPGFAKTQGENTPTAQEPTGST